MHLDSSLVGTRRPALRRRPAQHRRSEVRPGKGPPEVNTTVVEEREERGPQVDLRRERGLREDFGPPWVAGRQVRGGFPGEGGLELRPEEAETHYGFARVWAEKGDRDKEFFHLEEALRLEPEHARAHNDLSLLWAPASAGSSRIASEKCSIAASRSPFEARTTPMLLWASAYSGSRRRASSRWWSSLA